MWVDNPPSGRERAIETLIDMEPHGPFYRAARVLEESVPQALLNRPNLVTKAALVEQAYALAKYEIDQLAKYDAAFGERPSSNSFADRLSAVGLAQKERILRHHAKILVAKRGMGKVSVTPSPQLVSGLRQVYGESESLELRMLLQAVMDHSAFSKEEVGLSVVKLSEETANTSGAHQLESLIANLCRNEDEQARLLGLLISVMSIVTGYEIKDKSEPNSNEECDPTIPQPLQVGALLSVIKPAEDMKSDWSLDFELLNYLGEAAATYEERIEIQKSRLLARLDDSQEKSVEQSETPQTPSATTAGFPVEALSDTTMDPRPAVLQHLETPEPAESPDAIAIPEDSDAQDDIEAAAAALSAAVFEQIISAATREESSDDGDSSGSGSDHDSDYEESEQNGLEHESSSSSSSSSSYEVEPGEAADQNAPHAEGEQEDDDDDEDDEEVDTDEDIVLRQALALSIEDQTQPLHVHTAVSDDRPGEFQESHTLTTPDTSKGQVSAPKPKESPLPSIPTAPNTYPYAELIGSKNDDDEMEPESMFFDPSSLSHFGTLPAPCVLVHLLSYTLEMIQNKLFQGREDASTGARHQACKSTISGGVGCSLFPPNHPFLKSQRPSQDSGSDIAVPLQMLVSLFLLVLERRNDAIENLKLAVSQENRLVEVEGDQFGQENLESSTPTSEEGDDPAIALALHYLDNDAGETKESLEAKGMRRKAAAAAHDAAALLESLRRRTKSWKHQVKLFSQCTLLSMKCLRFFMQYIVRRWLQERQGISAVGCADLLPRTVISKLSVGLLSLSSTTSKNSTLGAVIGEEEELDEIFLFLPTYQESLILWAETVPMMFPSVSTQAEVLKSLLTGCSVSKMGTMPRALEKVTTWPSSDDEVSYHKLQMLCRRLRVSDLLDDFVSSPACYLPDAEESTIYGPSNSGTEKDPQRASALIAQIGSQAISLGGVKGELQNLYLALCHRCHVRVLLWDGLFACTEGDVDEPALSLTPSPADIVRVGANASNSLVFDSLKCSDSMAILATANESGNSAPNGASVHQRASKVWGTALASVCFSPKTGIHRWAVRLDKCERGHVFVGVATSQASTRTYVGGDRYGWGMIGTQALWHDRRKIRGDYGATFRTGSTIIVTLDTDAGTLSFSSWKDSASSSSFSLDPTVQSLNSPRRAGHVSGTIEDWGIAFEGLPLDSKLYPSVGLYQRDDRVTLLTVESGNNSGARESSMDQSGGVLYYPRMSNADAGDRVRENIRKIQEYNNLLAWDGIEYATKTLRYIVDRGIDGTDDCLCSTLLPSLAAALCLVPPSIPVLSQRCALSLLPQLTKCVLALGKSRGDRPAVSRLFQQGLRDGKWVIRATGSSTSTTDSEEYVVDLLPALDHNGSVIGFEGTGVGTTGKSKNGLVAILGTVKGSFVHFVEEWTDAGDDSFSAISSDDAASSCVVTARLSLDGTKFEGTYRNVQFGTSGQIAGVFNSEDARFSPIRLKDAPMPAKQSAAMVDAMISGEALLCLAHSHLATIAGEDSAADFSYAIEIPLGSNYGALDWTAHYGMLRKCLTLPILSTSSCGSSESALTAQLDSVQKLYSSPAQLYPDSAERIPVISETFLRDCILPLASVDAYVSFGEGIETLIQSNDSVISSQSGGTGSLSGLSRDAYQFTRRKLISVLIHHCGLAKALEEFTGEIVPLELAEAWGAAVKIMEDCVRTALSVRGSELSAREKATQCCVLSQKVGDFLLTLERRPCDFLPVQSAAADLAVLLKGVKSVEDISVLETELSRSTTRALLKLVPIHETLSVLRGYAGKENPVAVEALVAGIPRLLGKCSSSIATAPEVFTESDKMEYLGGHYLSNLAGAAGAFRSALQSNVHSLWTKLCSLLEAASSRIVQFCTQESLSMDSLVLALLVTFTTTMHREDVDYVVLRGDLVRILAYTLDVHTKLAVKTIGDNDLPAYSSVVKDIHCVACREVSRSIVRAAVAVSHVLTYQALRSEDVTTRRKSDSLPPCLELLLNQIKSTRPLIVDSVVHATYQFDEKMREVQWHTWLGKRLQSLNPKTPETKPKAPRHKVGHSGVAYLQQHGMTQITLSQGSVQKPSSRGRTTPIPVGQPGTEASLKIQDYFCHQLLTQWIHILVATSKSKSALELVAGSVEWMATLLGMIGLEFPSDHSFENATISIRQPTGSNIPSRFRSRLLRLLLPFLERQRPSESFVRSLLTLAGNNNSVLSKSFHEEESSVSREVITLLRRLHAPNLPDWRAMLNRVFTCTLDSANSVDSLSSKLGVLLFFNGGIENICGGSFVLLKPSAAAALSGEHQASPSSKGHPGSSGGGSSPASSSTPHHIVGNGTEGIVAGLCREEAAAGIVSNVDTKNGVCEVILLSRESKDTENVNQVPGVGKKSALSSSKGGSNARHTLTVRALRSPLADVVLAQEIGLCIDDSVDVGKMFVGVLKEALSICVAAKSGFSEDQSAVDDLATSNDRMDCIRLTLHKVSYATMAIKAAISALSDRRILFAFQGEEGARDVLSELLQISYKDERPTVDDSDQVKVPSVDFISSLPTHEARWVHIVNLFRELMLRTNILLETKLPTWKELVADYKRRSETALVPPSDSNLSTGQEGYNTPPWLVLDTPTAGGDQESRTVSSEAAASGSGETTPNAVSQSTVAAENSEEGEENEAAATAAAHLREAAIAQMAELGLPRSWSELALRRTGGTNIEAAVHFCLERGGEMERLLAAEERERALQRQNVGGSSSRRRGGRESGSSSHLLRQLMEMGFPSRWCAEAVTATGNNLDEALTWVLSNSERLSAEDGGLEGEDDDDADDNDEDEDDSQDDDDSDDVAIPTTEDGEPPCEKTEGSATDTKATSQSLDGLSEGSVGWKGSITPLRFISGRSIIDPRTLSISGLPSGGFSSVGTKGILLSTGKWYYEAILETAGCLQIGWGDGSFAGHCHADRGDGCGDGPSSWAYDGWRRYRWHATATEWGCRWKEGDVIGCMVDMDEKIVSFTLNGRGEEIGMGVAFSGQGFRPCGGVYACVSFNRREKLRLILGGSTSEPFRYEPPKGYLGVGVAVLNSVKERDLLVAKEKILDAPLTGGGEIINHSTGDSKKRFLCDFSDGEHGHELMAWAHRYYGSDASVHLGSGRMKQGGGVQKASSTTATTSDISSSKCLDRRVELAWSRVGNPGDLVADKESIREQIYRGYLDTATEIRQQLVCESIAMTSLYARKLLLHTLVTLGRNFNPDLLWSNTTMIPNALRFWKMIEASCSLRSAGWVGEAGAMAIAAEALGLGISSNGSVGSRQSGTERGGISSISDLDEGFVVPTGGIIQVLSSVVETSSGGNTVAISNSLAASSEAAIGSDGGGALVFLRNGLEGALCQSRQLREIALASVRRSIRLLSVVEYDSDDCTTSETKEDEDQEKSLGTPGNLESQAPDARLVSFLTGLLLSPKVEECVENHDENIKGPLFEAWSVGMLAGSLPWRMVCAFTASGILNGYPRALLNVIESFPTLRRFYSRLPSTVARRAWAERAAVPVCSRYTQAMLELLASVKRAVRDLSLPDDFMLQWNSRAVDAATPLPLPKAMNNSGDDAFASWEADEGWISSDKGWEIWTGSVEILAVDWKTPSRSAVRTLMDGGDGPPMLREGCTVMRGLDWAEDATHGDEDGKDLYEAEKARREADKRAGDEPETDNNEAQEPKEGDNQNNGNEASTKEVEEMQRDLDPAASDEKPEDAPTEAFGTKKKPKKKKKLPNPKLPIGTVISIEPWAGIPAMGRRVRWHLTGREGLYRYGGDGGRYDISHVEVNEKETRVKKRHPLPESAEQCAARHDFGSGKRYSVLLRLRKSTSSIDSGTSHEGIMEWPDFGAAILVSCVLHPDGTVTVREKEPLFGSKDSGWEARFGQPSFVPGTVFALMPSRILPTDQTDIDTKSPYSSLYEELVGTSSYDVPNLRNRDGGGALQVCSELRLFRGKRYQDGVDTSHLHFPPPPPIRFDRDYHAASLSLSRDGRTVSCVSSDGRGTAFASMGFTKGVHYWEVKLEQADIGSVFIGVAEKPSGSGSGSSYGYDTPPRLNRWHGWGFVNFRATYTAGAERIYGAHCHAGDTVGVLLDCDAGRISFFFDGLKYGEHILNDLGCAFENVSPFGFNVDGCGSGGAGQGAPSGIEGGRSGRYPAQGAVRPRALWPVVGLRNHGDRVTFSSKWSTSYGVDGITMIENALAFDELLQTYTDDHTPPTEQYPGWFVEEAFTEYNRWESDSLCQSDSRGSGPHHLSCFGLRLELDASPLACACASALLGLRRALLAGDRVRLRRSAGRVLELAEEAVVLGTYQGRLYYKIVSQKSEGGSLTEGGGRAWCWDESEVVDGVTVIGEPKGLDVELPMLDRFSCTSKGGLRIVYSGGAVVRSDLEILDGSTNLGSIPCNTILPKQDVLERRVNSCGMVRYRVRYDGLEGWISSRIRVGKEEAIVAPVSNDGEEPDIETSYQTPLECAKEWQKRFEEKRATQTSSNALSRTTNGKLTLEAFRSLLGLGVFSNMSVAESDSALVRAVGAISDHSDGGNPLHIPFQELKSAISFAQASKSGAALADENGSAISNQVSAAAFVAINAAIPPVDAIMVRVAALRALNRRGMYALPWLSLRPSQEGSAIFGGYYGHGASIERAGRVPDRAVASQWVQVSSIGSRIRSHRGLIFTAIKRELLQGITNVTTTPTPLSHDEYELPREIRTVRLNRLRARQVMMGNDTASKRKHSVFAQLHNETKNWGGAALRRGFVAKGHGGQKRAFKVKLIGEGVNDYSGPYREAFTDAIAEALSVEENGTGSLGVLDPTPNSISDIGENRGLHMFSLNGRDIASSSISKWASISDEERQLRSSFSTLTVTRDEALREVEEGLVFLGRITGTAFRHGIPLDLPLSLESVWKMIVEEPTDAMARLQELDTLATRQSRLSDCPNGLLLSQRRLLNSFVEGLSNVLPVEVLSLLSGEELRDAICGNPEVDVDLLRRVVEYEGFEESDEVIQFFWETLREFTHDERKTFLQFVWARNRLPTRETDFDAPFKIQKDSSNSKGGQALPSASTCFFSLSLPEYSSKAQLKEKLLFAINNVTTMETDFQTNSAEIAEGYRTI